MLFNPPQAFGLALDISQRKAADGKRLSAKIRNQLVEFVKVFEGDDALYLCQQDLKAAINEGERTSLVGNWESVEEALDLCYVLEYTLACISQEDADGIHNLCLVTDQLRKEHYSALSNINLLRQKGGLECRFVVIGVGLRYDTGSLAAFCQAEGIDFYHTPEPDRLAEVMMAWTKKE